MKGTAILFAIALFFGLVLAGGTRDAAAQDKSVRPAAKQKVVKKHDDDEDDNDGDVSADEPKSVAVTLEAARAVALARVKGTVIDEELEKEHGRLQYAFDIKDENGVVYDVEIDAMNGQVLYAAPDDEDDDSAATKTAKSKSKIARASKKKPH